MNGWTLSEMKINLQYVFAPKSKGKIYTYYRRNKQRIRIEGNIGSSEWLNNYKNIHKTFERPSKAPPERGTFAELIICYKTSPEFTELKPKTKQDYLRYLDILHSEFGKLPVATMPRKFVFALRDRYADKPRTANYMLSVLRRLLSFAVDRGYRTDNPALNFRQLKTGPGHKIWSKSDIELFRKHATPEMDIALLLAIYIGQRQGDILKMNWNQYKDGAIEVIQSKTKSRVLIPVHKELRKALERTPRTAIMILTTKTGQPFKSDYFKHQFRKIVLKAGLDGLTFHGLRKTATTMLAESGCTDREIMSITGHRTHSMVGHYLDRSNQERRASSAIHKLECSENKKCKTKLMKV